MKDLINEGAFAAVSVNTTPPSLLPSSLKVKTPRTRMKELEEQAKKKDAEIVSLTRKLNLNLKTLAEKETSLRALETKIPNMLLELRKNIEADQKKKVMSKDLRESMSRNRNLSGSMKRAEDQLKVKEDKLKEALDARRVLDDQLKAKHKELKESVQKVTVLERKVTELQRKLSEEERELERNNERRETVEVKYNRIFDENNLKDDIIEKLKTDVFHISNVASSRENEFEELKQHNSELQTVILTQNNQMVQMSREMCDHGSCQKIKNNGSKDHKAYSRSEVVSKSGEEARKSLAEGPLVSEREVAGRVRDEGTLDQATEQFLDRVSQVSKDRNLSVNLKLTVRKTERRSSIADKSILCGEAGGRRSSIMENLRGGRADRRSSVVTTSQAGDRSSSLAGYHRGKTTGSRRSSMVESFLEGGLNKKSEVLPDLFESFLGCGEVGAGRRRSGMIAKEDNAVNLPPWASNHHGVPEEQYEEVFEEAEDTGRLEDSGQLEDDDVSVASSEYSVPSSGTCRYFIALGYWKICSKITCFSFLQET